MLISFGVYLFSLIILLPSFNHGLVGKIIHEELFLLIIFFLYLKMIYIKFIFKNISLSHLIFISYFAIYLIGSIYFKHYAFSSYEEWNIFLNAQ